MQNNQSDRFEQVKISPFEKTHKANNSASENNFFINNSSIPINFTKHEQSRRLNSYDSILLEEDAYKDVEDDLFKLEYKISKKEDELKALDSQIQAARDINDYNLINELILRKETLSDDLKSLIETYSNKSISTKISGGFSNLLSDNMKAKLKELKSNIDYLAENIASRLPRQFSSLIELKKSLSKLENINKSVDELMSINAPYGENVDKYEQLSKYIIRANSIQAKISKHMK